MVRFTSAGPLFLGGAMFQKQQPTRRIQQLLRQVADLQAELEARDRTIRVQAVEIENLAAVVARDRERIKAEAATFARQRAELEGLTDGHPRPHT